MNRSGVRVPLAPFPPCAGCCATLQTRAARPRSAAASPPCLPPKIGPIPPGTRLKVVVQFFSWSVIRVQARSGGAAGRADHECVGSAATASASRSRKGNKPRNAAKQLVSLTSCSNLPCVPRRSCPRRSGAAGMVAGASSVPEQTRRGRYDAVVERVTTTTQWRWKSGGARCARVIATQHL